MAHTALDFTTPEALANVEVLATVLFGVAIVHTFSVKQFERLAHKHPQGSLKENLFHLLGEVEVVFGLWAGVFVLGAMVMAGGGLTLHYLEGHLTDYRLDFTEPAFVFAIMAMAATRPIIDLATHTIALVSRLVPLPDNVSFYAVALVLGPLLGSFITEPAAMTVTALVLKKRYYDRGISTRLMYATIGTLFVNVSIGGTLTNFAAPPVLMVAGTWGWDMGHMISHFGWKAAVAVVLNVIILLFFVGREVFALNDQADDPRHLPPAGAPEGKLPVPWWLTVVHLAFLTGVVLFAHHMVVFLGIFLYFLGVVAVTDEYQTRVQLRESLLVGFFLAGLVTLGGFQKWWLQPLLSSLGDVELFVGATGLTAVTDNAALTYLGTLVDGMTDSAKFALVAGAVAGGGLTVIANAPNPAGYGILKSSFPDGAISPLRLLLSALVPTVVAMACLWYLPSLS